jgi:hypothetical protein
MVHGCSCFSPIRWYGYLQAHGTDPLRVSDVQPAYSISLLILTMQHSLLASRYWGVNLSVKYGKSTSISNTTMAGFVDTGTSLGMFTMAGCPYHHATGATLISLRTEAYNSYISSTGAVLDSTNGFLRITKQQYQNLESLFFHIDDGVNTFLPCHHVTDYLQFV